MVGFTEFVETYGWIIIFATIIIFTGLTMYYYSKKDIYDPEPARRLIWGFILGIVSVIPAFILSLIGATLVGYNQVITTILVAPVMEEIAKLWFVIYLARSNSFDGPLDGLIYGAMVGAGFAAAENLLYATATFLDAGALSGVTLTAFRSLTQIVGHPLYTGLAGVGVGEWKVGMTTNKYGKLWRSILFHGLWNLAASLGTLGGIIGGLVIVISINIYVLRSELKRTLALDKDAYERGYYEQKQARLDQINQMTNSRISRWENSPAQAMNAGSTPNTGTSGQPGTFNNSIGPHSSDPLGVPSSKQQTITKCATCGTEKQPGDIFCRECGSKEEQVIAAKSADPKLPKFCKYCGGQRVAGDRFCRQCGTQFVNSNS